MIDRRRRLPAVHALVADARAAGVGRDAAPADLTAAVREVIQAVRDGSTAPDDWVAAVRAAVAARTGRSLRRVINATGVVLHTNLGRAPLAAAAEQAMRGAAGYAALEVDLATGRRGSRQDHTSQLLRDLTGAEDALVVNNAAAALMFVLRVVGQDGETLVSRGELIEIGGGFRLPEVLAESGTVLLEVGTTNRTRLADYTAALTARTRCVLRVHRSNFRLDGFTSEPTLGDLVNLAAPRGLPCIHDVGSGLLMDLTPWGLSGEPLVADSVAAGALTVCSGDKLLGGPQSGIIVGPQRLMEPLRRHPLARALRPDKTVLAALEATLQLYRDPTTARVAIPVLAMLTADLKTIRNRARRVRRGMPGAELTAGHSEVGGGSFPGIELPTTLVALSVPDPDTFLATLRAADPPVLARIDKDRVLFDVRTVPDADVGPMAAIVAAARGQD